MSKKSKWGFATKSIHIGNKANKEHGSVAPPIHLTSTFKQDGVGQNRGHDYSRVSNPTRSRLEENLAALEGSNYAVCYSSGMAATTALFQLFDKDDHILVSRNTYGGTYRMAMNVLSRQGIDFEWIDTRDPQNINKRIKENTKLVHVESPTNPLLELCDIEETAKICKSKNVLLSVDNTFMSPYGQRPLEIGADIAMQSSTKSLSGHSDILGGVLTTNDDELHERLQFMLKATGGVPSPFDNWITLRSTKTLALRYQKASDNALELAKWLSTLTNIHKTIYPGLESHPQHDIATKQQLSPNGDVVYGAMLSIDVGNVNTRDEFLKKIEIFQLAESLGSVESLVCIPYFMTHAAVPESTKLEMGITESLIRLSIGIEDFSDLRTDLADALS
ncbi:MAG: aminotransferase class I/II-fold pyridoxal phosphate-dependent enzyme [Candidatus Neomarinimicrobiota bacterium]|jgi:cystathionine beta-lyase/cystathionine gamma-synthase|nr:aminotransferase class I/II-fold pyridoxal phosphate-dependent enzyme [Candidatus Neomarinimicrobiota bacterium]MEC9437734.1 aminotransferase class I/II-fold pyridoxal phosphate-dependent enzyme [Candidatus Neomarinimicrobiota bacterium]MEC9474541.1 aminotransferase class I/II-fold pyridoxal phosphate-dependent enzyme [Candidatus Neomarinimicrobiota bacterium]MED5433831.1 aminotransferase class I/II-fold pyridoxal phosphate-dependent enzyme [Candidatus Neomarinimicrobiota bacterium]MEE330273|tara:strand:- start:3055 stop:4224 length:1170 start_codon:yes stop_codon:yes gene_type:complete